jgi:hypothetical protein
MKKLGIHNTVTLAVWSLYVGLVQISAFPVPDVLVAEAAAKR